MSLRDHGSDRGNLNILRYLQEGYAGIFVFTSPLTLADDPYFMSYKICYVNMRLVKVNIWLNFEVSDWFFPLNAM